MGEPLVLVPTPVKNAVEHLPRYFALTAQLDTPADRIGIGLLDGDGDDGTHEALAAMLPDLGERYRRVDLVLTSRGGS